MAQQFKVRTLYSNGSYVSQYGTNIGQCEAVFESDRTYEATVFSGIYQRGEHLVHDFVVDVLDGKLDGYDRPCGRSYRTLTEFNSEFAVIE